MSDYLVELAKNPQVRQLVKNAGLPIPMPQDLRRQKTPRAERILADRTLGVCTSAESPLAPILANTFAVAGANVRLSCAEGQPPIFAEQAEAYGRMLTHDAITDEVDARFDALVFDATGLDGAGALRQLYDYFHPRLRALARNGRIVVIGRAPEKQTTPGAAAAQAALDGFVRSIAKEIGAKGGGAHLLTVDAGAEDRLPGPLRFMLSPASSYVTGQPLHVSATVDRPLPTHWERPLEGKTALVTGAARGIGAQTARILASEGARVVCLDRPADDGPTSKLARELGGVVLLADVTDPDAPNQIATALAELGGVDIVVHNAGITRDKTLQRMKPEWWDQTVAVNLGAVIAITEKLLADGVLNQGGAIVCLSSIAGVAGNRGQTNYSASKAGIIGLVRHLSAMTSARGITVNAIAPGFIETRMTNAMPFAIREAARRMNNLGQGGKPGDVGQAITFLATPGALGITGQVLRVCGGSLVGA